MFVGQRNEPFVVNLGPVFDLINFVPIEGDSAPGKGDRKGFPGGITQDDANDIISDKNITTLALEVHKSCLVGSRQRRDRRVDVCQLAAGARAEPARDVRDLRT